MKNIIRKNVKSVDHNKDIRTIIYYCNRKVNNIIMTNNLNRNEDPLAMSHVVYEIKCPVGGCELVNPSYIGQTRNNIRIRLSQHKQNGAIIEHLALHHNITNITLEELTSNVSPCGLGAPVVWPLWFGGIRIQPTFALVRVVRGD